MIKVSGATAEMAIGCLNYFLSTSVIKVKIMNLWCYVKMNLDCYILAKNKLYGYKQTKHVVL